MVHTDRFWFIRNVVRKIYSSSEGGSWNLRPKAFSAAKKCLVAVAYPPWVSLVTLELNVATALSTVFGSVPMGNANLESLIKGCGTTEYFGSAFVKGKDNFFLFLRLSRSKTRPFLFPCLILMNLLAVFPGNRTHKRGAILKIAKICVALVLNSTRFIKWGKQLSWYTRIFWMYYWLTL